MYKDFDIVQKKYWQNGHDKRRHPSHPAVEAFVLPELRFMQKHIKLDKSVSLLEVGCGNSYFTYYLSQLATVVGLDSSRHMLSMNPSNRLVHGSAYSLPFKNNSFDLVFSSNLFHHLSKSLDAAKEMKRVSRRFVVWIEPNRYNPAVFLFGILKKSERETIKYSRKYLQRMAGSAGLTIIDSRVMGMVAPNCTPVFLLPVFKRFNRETFLGMHVTLIAQK